MRARIITTVFASFFHSCSNGGRQALTEAERGPAKASGLRRRCTDHFWYQAAFSVLVRNPGAGLSTCTATSP
jgi:hypothetical protein